MRDSAGSCASIRARRSRPLREFGPSNACQRLSTGVGTDGSSKAKGFRDVGNGQSTVLTNLCAPQVGGVLEDVPGRTDDHIETLIASSPHQPVAGWSCLVHSSKRLWH